MDLPALFQKQNELNRRIIKQQGLQEDLTENQKLALLVELGELANEWRGFKVWRADRSPRRLEMLEEYVDCLHFFASTGLMLKVDPGAVEMRAIRLEDTISQFRELFRRIAGMETAEDWERSFRLFLGLGEMLGLTQVEIERAHEKKHRINYERLKRCPNNTLSDGRKRPSEAF